MILCTNILKTFAVQVSIYYLRIWTDAVLGLGIGIQDLNDGSRQSLPLKYYKNYRLRIETLNRISSTGIGYN